MKISFQPHDAAFSRIHGIFLILVALLIFEVGVNYSEKPAATKPAQKTNVVYVTQEVTHVQTYVPAAVSYQQPVIAEPLVRTNARLVMQRPTNSMPARPAVSGTYNAQPMLRTSQQTRKQTVTFTKQVPPNVIRIAVP